MSLHFSPCFSRPTISCFPKPHMPKPIAATPARDRVIDFGKYKGKMLGTLPSAYIKWISKNVRAGDFEEWAKLADEVLEDPVYIDRIEWEFAQKVLSGDVFSSSSLSSNSSAVSELLDISERFGWDNEDKLGWANIDFGLLGTSKGSRIPRIASSAPRPIDTFQPKIGNKYSRSRSAQRENTGDESQRRRRRERLMARRKSLINKVDVEQQPKQCIGFDGKSNFGISSNNHSGENIKADEDTGELKSPFPGRALLLKKVLSRRRQ